MKKICLTAALLCSAFGAAAQSNNEIVFTQSSQLMQWCHEEAKAHFAGKGEATYQWSANHYNKGNTLVVEGQLRTDKGDVPVTCRVASGAREKYATVKIGK